MIYSWALTLICFRITYPEISISDAIIIVGTFSVLFGGLAICINDGEEERRLEAEENEPIFEA